MYILQQNTIVVYFFRDFWILSNVVKSKNTNKTVGAGYFTARLCTCFQFIHSLTARTPPVTSDALSCMPLVNYVITHVFGVM